MGEERWGMGGEFGGEGNVGNGWKVGGVEEGNVGMGGELVDRRGWEWVGELVGREWWGMGESWWGRMRRGFVGNGWMSCWVGEEGYCGGWGEELVGRRRRGNVGNGKTSL